ncbi:right-handed parallel beta-helix repeat-containing protein [Actinorugispora endophytica]|uniref:Parallel beta helix pectate lyase-like protein n=1 Tax=Actinorugispora endophytica TaxID=1605990 RepID=A0A4R6UM35_9ACTN|nr:right-handed parallel beta-helix repeat-containing protein [Actinorugispora endophytica]TDQ47246.1 parallel beta helix pectate lyase-like protein [Actinorugispora endophytica]
MIFVDPSGDDSGPGTFERPFATPQRARDAAAPGTVVVLRAGTYRLTDTLRLSAEHSGVVYQAHGYGTADQEEVVISGGRAVTGWTRDPDGIHRARLPGPAPRQLYVNGRRAERAAVALEHPMVRTPQGYVVEGLDLRSWQGDVEFVYRGAYPWSEARCPVARISADADSAAVTMARPAFERATRLYHSVITWDGPGNGESHGVDSPTHAENSPAFVTGGTFATAGTVVYYRPLPGEDLDEVVAPVLETLLHGRGVHDVAFRGITFAEATWSEPSTPEGFLHYHGNGYHTGGDLLTVTFAEGRGRVTVPGETTAIPGNVVFEDSSRVRLEGCRFTRLGAVALEFRGAGADNTVCDGEITEVSGGGLVVGEGACGHRVENNRVHRVGLDYRGSPAVLLSGTSDTTVAHNEVYDVPHAGIMVYPGRGTRVLDNLVHDTMLVLADGGGIYLSGAQGDRPSNGALVRGNVVRDTVTPYNFGLYTDYGASWVTVEGNAVYRADAPVALNVSPPLEHVVLTGNFWDADPGDAPEGVVLADNTTLPREAFDGDPRVAVIASRAGLRRARENTPGL